MGINQVQLICLSALILFSCQPVRFTAKEQPVSSPVCPNEACVEDTGPTVWQITGTWGDCSQACGGGTQSQAVTCINTKNQPLPDTSCKEAKPPTMRACNTQVCGPGGSPTPSATPNPTPNPTVASWLAGAWSNCSVACGGGTKTRTVVCKTSTGEVDASNCNLATKDKTSEECNTQACPPNTTSKIKTVTVPPTQNQVDILLVVDDSSSMTTDNTKLANRLGGFLTSLQTASIDWQMCVTTTDVGYYEGRPLYWSGTSTRVLNKNTGVASSIVQQTIHDIGSGFSNDEQGVKASVLSVMNNAVYPCYRPGAAIAVIIISDEDERSVGGITSLSSQQYQPLGVQNYPATYVNTVKTTFGADKRFAVNSIVVKDNNCKILEDAEGSPGFIGTRYIELADLTGGKNGSICDADYSANLRYFKDVIANTLSGFDLECAPYGAANVGLPAGYTYVVSGSHINFTPVLQAGVTVTVTYQCLL